jgi:DNA segregation ATPase FtsK/SpoIIIE-like protein
MKLDDAKFVLAELLDKEIVDSLVNVYMIRDAVNKSTIELQVKEIRILQQKSVNYEQQIVNLEKIITNKDTELTKVNQQLEDQKKETKKQKALKKLGFIGTVVLPIIVLIILI